VSGQSAADLGEFALIDRITTHLAANSSVQVGVGDDAAVLRLAGDLAVSTDTMVEDVHFRRSWSAAQDVGRKAVAACVADAEAMGAVPVGIVISLALPSQTAVEWVDGFAEGVAIEADRAGVALVGGDLTSAPVIVVTVTVLADQCGREPITRAGAKPGEVVAMTGRLGWAAAGLAVLTRGFRSPAAVVVAHRVPEVPYGQGRIAADAGAGAMIDISDGLLADLGHLCRASGVCVDLDSSAFEIAEPQQAVAAAVGGGDPLVFQLTGGDDHALVATFAPNQVPDGWTVLGRVLPGDPAVLVDGAEPDLETLGWKHF
jgi:thiamine-monophosphate kinase